MFLLCLLVFATIMVWYEVPLIWVIILLLLISGLVRIAQR